jgi:hypothetical protein
MTNDKLSKKAESNLYGGQRIRKGRSQLREDCLIALNAKRAGETARASGTSG